MAATDPVITSTSSRRKRLWVAVALALVVIAVIAVASGGFENFTSGLHDGFTGKARSAPVGPR